MIKKIIIIFIVIVILLVSGFFIFKKDNQEEYVTEKVEKGKIIQTVSETGTIKSAKEIELNFLESGKIATTSVNIGDKVIKDQILAELDYSSFSIKKQEAQANLDVAKANLDKILSGSTSYEVAVSKAQSEQARIAYLSSLEDAEKVKKTTEENILQAEKKLFDLDSSGEDNVTAEEQAITTAEINLENIKKTYQKSIDNKKDIVLTTIGDKLKIANTALDNIDRVLKDSDIQEVLSVQNKEYLNNTEETYNSATILLDEAENIMKSALKNNSDYNIKKAVDGAFSCFNKVFESLDYCYKVLENSITSYSFTQTELDAFKTSISSQTTYVATAISALQLADQNLSDAELTYLTNVSEKEESLNLALVNLKNAIKQAEDDLSSARILGEQQLSSANTGIKASSEAWDVAKTQLEKVQSPARSQDVELAKAQIKQAEASLNLIQNQIENSVIKAPIDGIVIKSEYEIGEQVLASKPVFSILTENNFEVEVDISESNISKIKENDLVKITLDAFGEDVKFKGKVYFIEPAETVIQDVIYYKVKIIFFENNLEAAKSGMTANIIITTAEKDNVLIMPGRAIIEKNGDGKFVKILKNGVVSEVPIKIGLRGDEGMVEVVSGVEEGEDVITYVKSK